MGFKPRETGRLRESELAIGLVAAVGTNLEPIVQGLEDRLGQFGYRCNTIHLSSLLGELLDKFDIGVSLDDRTEDARIRSRMNAGNALRRQLRPDILALAAMATIDLKRTKSAVESQPLGRVVHIFRTLKNPDEVRTLRSVYGSGFFLIGVFADQEEREAYLVEDKAVNTKNASALIERDQGELDANGQQTRETFQLADAFVKRKEDVWRVLDLLHGDPFATPSFEETAMFLAFATSLRSADLSRQIGAVLTSPQREILSVGCNDVPAPGGGLYWPDAKDDRRDFQLGYDSNAHRRNEIVRDVIKRFDGDEPSQEASGKLDGSLVLDVTEYGRPVHAEMEALLAAGRVGASTRQATLFGTTFPCHNCAKHIVAGGICRVVYVEPYPKSLAPELFGDSITFSSDPSDKSKKTLFEPFLGIGPRRFFDLFSLRLGSGYAVRRKSGITKIEWERAKSDLRVSLQPLSYLEREAEAVSVLDELGSKDAEQ